MNHTMAWVSWTLCAAATALLIRNPMYLALVGLAAAVVYVAAEQKQGRTTSWRGLLRIGAMVWVLTIPFNALMVHQGTHVLFHLPSNWPLVGGNITLEAVAYGAASGLALWVLLMIFSAFNVVLDASQLLRLAPPFLYQAGVVTSIALTFMPQMLASAKEIREAQQLRGHRFKGWRDLLPLVLPLLTTALERAIQLAESLESRGFGGELTNLSPRENNVLRLGILGSLAGLLVGLFLYTYSPRAPWMGIALMVLAAGGMIYAFASLGSHVKRSHYRRSHWNASDTLIVVCSAIALLTVVIVRSSDAMALVYYPYPPYSIAPEFNIWIGLALVLLALPGLVALFTGADLVPLPTPDALQETL